MSGDSESQLTVFPRCSVLHSNSPSPIQPLGILCKLRGLTKPSMWCIFQTPFQNKSWLCIDVCIKTRGTSGVVYICVKTGGHRWPNFPRVAETVNRRPGKQGEVCTATSAMIALRWAPQQLVSESPGPVVACYYALAKSVTACLRYLANRTSARANPAVDNLSHLIHAGRKLEIWAPPTFFLRVIQERQNSCFCDYI